MIAMETLDMSKIFSKQVLWKRDFFSVSLCSPNQEEWSQRETAVQTYFNSGKHLLWSELLILYRQSLVTFLNIISPYYRYCVTRENIIIKVDLKVKLSQIKCIITVQNMLSDLISLFQMEIKYKLFLLH